jgi:hypothetical protein
MEDKKPDYRSFMLRLWIEKTNGEKWRYSLEDTHTGKRKGFASVDKLIAYLEEITNESQNSSNRTE